MDDIRIDRMVDSAPSYYQYSQVFRKIQEAPGREYDTIDERNNDLRKQLYIPTATWGLIYWEEVYGIKTVEIDGYEMRRGRVLSRRRGLGQFSANLVKSVCEAYSQGEVIVAIDSDVNNILNITFVGQKGEPAYLPDLKEVIADIIHAHLGPKFHFTWLKWDDLDPVNLSWDELDRLKLTWDVFEVWDPSTLGPEDRFTLIYWNALDAAGITWDRMDAAKLTWDALAETAINDL